MRWVLLVITLIGLIPVLGSLAKGVLKLLIKKAGDISALRALYGIFNYFKKGNAHRWLVNFAHDLTGKHLDTALGLLDEMMTRVVRHMTEAKGWFSSRWNRRKGCRERSRDGRGKSVEHKLSMIKAHTIGSRNEEYRRSNQRGGCQAPRPRPRARRRLDRGSSGRGDL